MFLLCAIFFHIAWDPFYDAHAKSTVVIVVMMSHIEKFVNLVDFIGIFYHHYAL